MKRDVSDLISDALTKHGIKNWIGDDAIVSLADRPVGFRGEFKSVSSDERGVMLELTVGATGPGLGERAVWESFAGFGSDEERAGADAFAKFLLSSFHVLLNVLAGHECPSDGTVWSTWQGPQRVWRVCDSALLVQDADPIAMSGTYGVLFEEFKALFLTEASPEPHWISVFFSYLNGQPGAAEIAFDGKPSADAKAAWNRWNYSPPTQGFVTGRHFFMALPQV